MAPIFLEALANDAMRQLRSVAFAAQMPKVQIAQFGGHDLLGGVGGSFVRKMAMPAQNALLEAPGTGGAILEHLDVMVRFEHERMGRSDPFEHQASGMAQVRQETNVPGASAEQVTNRVLGVVRNAERLDQDVAHFKTGSGGEEPARQARLVLILHRLEGGPVAIDGNVQLLAEQRQALHMIRVLVRDQDPSQILRRPANGGEALANLAQAEARVNQDAGLFGFHIGTVAGGTAAKDGQANRHSLR